MDCSAQAVYIYPAINWAIFAAAALSKVLNVILGYIFFIRERPFGLLYAHVYTPVVGESVFYDNCIIYRCVGRKFIKLF